MFIRSFYLRALALKPIRNKHFQVELVCGRKFSTFPFILSNSYVKIVRAQQKVKESSECQNHLYTKGQYLILDSEKELVLVKDNISNQTHTLVWNNYNDISSIGLNVKKDAVFLSMNDNEQCKFAVKLSATPKEKKVDIESKLHGKFLTLRASLFTLSAAEAVLVSQSHSLLNWQHRYKFCSACGGRLGSQVVGAQKMCSSCSETHYPHISPVGIALVSNRDHSKVLLVRQPMFPPGMYTCIAGYIEVGESVEENVKREVAEEVGLEVSEIQYIASQHWSLPASRLMIACLATVQREDFVIDKDELEDAGWFTPQEVRSALNRVTSRKAELLSEPSELWVPPKGAVAHDLIKHWLQEYH